uniref:Uncharacterized protein n=1 Tax=candidate division WOR-3 bacterium TaxID=2052148 RepID=A0A7C6AG36_UNCW3
MDKDSSPVLIKNIYWYDDRTILVRCYDSLEVRDDTTGLQFNTNYLVKILGTAEDTSGATLDGNKNGKSVTLTPNNSQADLKFYTNYLNARNFTNSGIEICSNFSIIFRIEEFSDADRWKRMLTDGGGYNASV